MILEHDWLLLMEMSKSCCFQGLDQHNQQVVLNVTSYTLTEGDIVDFNESLKFCFATSRFITGLWHGISTKGGYENVYPWCDETIDAKMLVQPTSFNK
jgi:hypothetical protein